MDTKYKLNDIVKLTDNYVKNVIGVVKVDEYNKFIVNNIYYVELSEEHVYTVLCARENNEVRPDIEYAMLNFGVKKLYELKNHTDGNLYYTIEKNVSEVI